MQKIEQKGCFEALHNIFNSSANVIVVTGRKSYKRLYCWEDIEGGISGDNVVHYNDVLSNPTREQILPLVKLINDVKPFCIVALGGGSVIDTVKCARYWSEFSGIDFIAIPTTSGTGSESTQFATYYIDKQKKSLDDPSLLPSAAILDGNLLMSLPDKILVETIGDAFCQAIESFWSIRSTTESLNFANRAIKCIYNIVKRDDLLNYKDGLIEASNFAGRAINITRTTACHSVSYPMTSFFDVAHGQAVSVTMPYFYLYNWKVTLDNCNDDRGVDFVRKQLRSIANILGAQDAYQASLIMIKLFEKIGLKTKLSDLLRSEKDLEVIIENGFTPSRMGNNPRHVGKNELREVLINAYKGDIDAFNI